MASAMPVFTIRSSSPMLSNGEIFRGSIGLDVGVDEVPHVGLIGFQVEASRRWPCG